MNSTRESMRRRERHMEIPLDSRNFDSATEAAGFALALKDRADQASIMGVNFFGEDVEDE